MGLFEFLKKPKPRSVWDALQENPLFQEQKALFDAMSAMCESGCDTDEVPNGRGEFGHSLDNPVPTKTIFGSETYLARLRALDGAKIIYERLGSTSSRVVQGPIDIYDIKHPDGVLLMKLYISPYQKRNSPKAPRGLALIESPPNTTANPPTVPLSRARTIQPSLKAVGRELDEKTSPHCIATEHCRLLQKDRAAGFPESSQFFPQESQIDSDAVKDEWLYFQIFLFDFAVYQAFGPTAAKAAVLTPFWTHVKGWLQNQQVAALPVRLAVAGGGPRSIPAEPTESSYARLIRRVQQYASAVSSPMSQGVNYSVAAVFASAAGDMNALSILGVSLYFSSLTAQLVKLLQKLRIAE